MLHFGLQSMRMLYVLKMSFLKTIPSIYFHLYSSMTLPDSVNLKFLRIICLLKWPWRKITYLWISIINFLDNTVYWIHWAKNILFTLASNIAHAFTCHIHLEYVYMEFRKSHPIIVYCILYVCCSRLMHGVKWPNYMQNYFLHAPSFVALFWI